MAEIKTYHLEDADRKRLQSLFITHRENKLSYIKTSPGSCILPSDYQHHKEQIRNFKIRLSDIYVLSWAKNGTTWTQEMVWLIQNGCDFQTAKKVSNLERIAFLEFSLYATAMEPKIPGMSMEESLARIEGMDSPRIIKSHLPYCLLPADLLDSCKVVTCLRNPKDTLVSFYHHEKMMKHHGYSGDFAAYFDLFMDDLVCCGPYWEYVVQAWSHRNHPNLCLLFFEDSKKDLAGSVTKVAKFLEKDLTDEQVKSLVENLTFKKMKENSAAFDEALRAHTYTEPENKDQSFFRRGEVGDWKNYFTEEMNKRMDEAIEKHFKGIGLEFRYE